MTTRESTSTEPGIVELRATLIWSSSRDDVAKVVITEQTVRENVNPTIVTRQPSRRERREKSA